jgi:hypothetical protein
VLGGNGRPAFELKASISVPGEIYEWKGSVSTRQHALDVQTQNRKLLTSAFTDGLAVLGYERNAAGEGRFLLGAWDEKLEY